MMNGEIKVCMIGVHTHTLKSECSPKFDSRLELWKFY